jgi:hypothetical protein
MSLSEAVKRRIVIYLSIVAIPLIALTAFIFLGTRGQPLKLEYVSLTPDGSQLNFAIRNLSSRAWMVAGSYDWQTSPHGGSEGAFLTRIQVLLSRPALSSHFKCQNRQSALPALEFR